MPIILPKVALFTVVEWDPQKLVGRAERLTEGTLIEFDSSVFAQREDVAKVAVGTWLRVASQQDPDTEETRVMVTLHGTPEHNDSAWGSGAGISASDSARPSTTGKAARPSKDRLSVTWYLGACIYARSAADLQETAVSTERAAKTWLREVRSARRDGTPLSAEQDMIVEVLSSPLPRALSKWLGDLHSVASSVLTTGQGGTSTQSSWRWLEEQAQKMLAGELEGQQCTLLKPLLDQDGLLAHRVLRPVMRWYRAEHGSTEVPDDYRVPEVYHNADLHGVALGLFWHCASGSSLEGELTWEESLAELRAWVSHHDCLPRAGASDQEEHSLRGWMVMQCMCLTADGTRWTDFLEVPHVADFVRAHERSRIDREARLFGKWDERWMRLVQPALKYYHMLYGNLDISQSWVSPPELGGEPIGGILYRMSTRGYYLRDPDTATARARWLREHGWCGANEAEWYPQAVALSRYYTRHGCMPHASMEQLAVQAASPAPRTEEFGLAHWLKAQCTRVGALSPAKRFFLAAIPGAGVSAGCTAELYVSLPLPPTALPQGRQLLDEAALGAAARGQLLLETGAAVRQIDHGRSYRELIDLPRLRRFARSRANGDTAAARGLLERAQEAAAGAAEPPRVLYYRTAFSARRWHKHGVRSLQHVPEHVRSAAAGAHYAQLGVTNAAPAILAHLTGREVKDSLLGAYALAPHISGEAELARLCDATGCSRPAAAAFVERLIFGGTVQGWCSEAGVGKWPTQYPECSQAWVAQAAARAATLPAEAQPNIHASDPPPELAQELRKAYQEWYFSAPPELQALLQGLPERTAKLVRDVAAAREELLQHDGVRELGRRVAEWCDAEPDDARGPVVRRKPEHTTLSLVLSIYQDLIMGTLEEEARRAGWEVGCLLQDGLLIRRAEGAANCHLPQKLLAAMAKKVQKTFGFKVTLEQRPWVKPTAEATAELPMASRHLHEEQERREQLRREQDELDKVVGPDGEQPDLVAFFPPPPVAQLRYA